MELEKILKQLSKIAAIDSSIIEYITTQLSKIAAIDSSAVDPIVTGICKSLVLFPTRTKDMCDVISDGQIQSKQWIVDQVIDLDLGNIFLCGGWHALLLQEKRLKFKKCISIDIDPDCEIISKIFNKSLLIDNWKFQAATANIHDINYTENMFLLKRSDNSVCELAVSPDTIINTSCEHIENFNEWWKIIPDNKLVILQSNNGYGIAGHVNCVSSLDEFELQTPLSKVFFSGEKNMPKFTRYMRIGYK